MSAQSDPQCTRRTFDLAAAGDAMAWRQIVAQYSPRVFALLVKQCGDRELAEELTQAAFVQIVTSIGRYDDQGRFDAYVFRIAMNKLRDEMRRRGRQAMTMDMTGARQDDGGGSVWEQTQHRIIDRHPTGSADPFEQASRSEQVELVRSAIAKLSDADQEVLHLRHIAGLSFVQIADTLDQPVGTVLARGHRALKKLRTMLESAAEESPSGACE